MSGRRRLVVGGRASGPVRRLARGACGALALVLLSAALAACSEGSRGHERAPELIQPGDFALVACGPQNARVACALAVAGGKRLLFGAPAGLADSLQDSDLRQLDAVVLFSLRAGDIEGLDEVRNASWRAGRSEPLLVIGPDGTSRMVDALNLAFEQADALRIVAEGIPPGGYDSAVLTAREIARGSSPARVFDTGDLKVTARETALGHVVYEVSYGVSLVIAPCGLETGDGEADDVGESGRKLDCSGSDLNWPLTETQFIVRN